MRAAAAAWLLGLVIRVAVGYRRLHLAAVLGTDPHRCERCRRNIYCPLTRHCPRCDRTEAGRYEKTVTRAGAAWPVADRWRDLQQGGRP